MFLPILTSIVFLFFIYALYKKLNIPLFYSIIIGIILRIVYIVAFLHITNYDLDSYHLIGEVTLRGQNIYPSPANLHHPYIPVMLYIEAFSMFLEQFGISYVVVLKTFFAAFDIGIIYLIYLLTQKNTRKALLYAVNPVSILITCVQGQFESIPLFFLLLAYYFMHNHKDLKAVIFFGCAILFKTWPLLISISLFKRIKQKQLLVILPIMIFLTILFYTMIFKAPFMDIVFTLLSYTGIYTIYGLSIPLDYLGLPVVAMRTLMAIFLAFFTVISVKRTEKNIIDEVSFLLMIFFVFTLSFGMQWLMWLVPFIIIRGLKYSSFFFAIGTVYISSIYVMWLMSGNPLFATTEYQNAIKVLSMSVWAVNVFMFISNYKNLFAKRSNSAVK